MGLALAMPLPAEEVKDTEATKKKGPEKVFIKKDKNEDGLLSKEEFTAGAKDATKAEAKTKILTESSPRRSSWPPPTREKRQQNNLPCFSWTPAMAAPLNWTLWWASTQGKWGWRNWFGKRRRYLNTGLLGD